MKWSFILGYLKRIEPYYIGLVILSYLLGFFLKDFNFRKLKVSIISKSFYISILALVVGFISNNTDIKNITFTFSSVYLGFWLNEEMKKIDERQRLKMYLGLLWQELRFNIHQLEVIKANYSFYLEDIQYVVMNFRRFSNIHTLCKLLKTNAYQAYLNSGAVNSLTAEVFKKSNESDDIFNVLEIAYNDISYLKSFLEPVLLDFETKVQIRTGMAKDPNIIQYDADMINDLKKKITEGANELAISYRTCVIARDKVDMVLSKLEVKSDLETDRRSVLLDKDIDFISQILKTEFSNVRNPFQSHQENQK